MKSADNSFDKHRLLRAVRASAAAVAGGRLRRIGEDLTEELEYVNGPSPSSLNRWRTMALHREPDRPPPADLFVLRLLHPSPAAVAPDRAGPPRAGPLGACAGQRIRRSPAALPPEPDLRPRGARSRPVHPGRLGRQDQRPAGAAGRGHRPPRPIGRGDLCRRHADQHAGARHRQDPDGPALDVCP